MVNIRKPTKLPSRLVFFAGGENWYDDGDSAEN